MGGLAKKLIASAGGEEKLYVDDVFSTTLYTGNGSTQTINNGIDLAGEGGMVWLKNRLTTDVHILQDTDRGANKVLRTNTTDAEATIATYNFAFLNNGFSMNTGAGVINQAPQPYASWTFRKAPKFFDVVTYTGNGATQRRISHSLGATPGAYVIKATSTTNNWKFVHRGSGTVLTGFLNTTDAMTNQGWSMSDKYGSATDFEVGTSWVSDSNTNGVSYVAYLFAHDPSEDGIIQCGSWADTSGVNVELGWEPQYILWKNASSVSNWRIKDVMRGLTGGRVSNTGDRGLNADESGAETALGQVQIHQTGFFVPSMMNVEGNNWIYLAIRRPNKPPKSGTEVFAANDLRPSSATQLVTSGFAADAIFAKTTTVAAEWTVEDKLRGIATGAATGDTKRLVTNSSSAQVSGNPSAYELWNQSFRIGNYLGGNNIATYAFRRAPGFMDVVCYTGTGSANRVLNHNLGVAPELIITKQRIGVSNWNTVYGITPTTQSGITLNSSGAGFGPSSYTPGNWILNAAPTASTITIGSEAAWNGSGSTYVTYLFASLPGISKVGSYVGNGGSQTINCGFTTGARFILIKRTDSTGDWYVWDSARGIVSANDPHLSLNTTAAEVTTDDSVDPESTGFIVNQNTATNINVNGGSYIFLAIA